MTQSDKETLLRQWAMLRQIPRHPRKIDSRTLQARLAEQGFEIHLRSIQRDLKALSTVFPLTSDEPARPVGWSWAGRDVSDLPGMDPPTALTFHLAERFLERLLPRATLRHLEPHFRRARAVLGQMGAARLSRWPRKVRLLGAGQPLEPPRIPAAVLDGIYEGLLGERLLAVRYVRRGEKSARDYEVNPLGLVVRDGVVYLVCTLWDYSDVVQLLLHRMRSVAVLDAGARPVTGFDLDAYVAQGSFGFRVGAGTLKLRAAFNSDAAVHLGETRLSADQRLRELEDGRVQIEATVPDTAQLRWWLLGFGDRVEVLAPARLRREIANIVKRTSALYA